MKDMMDQKDSDLVKKFKEGEEKAFNQLVLRYQKRIYHMIYRMVRNKQDAADLSMEVFVRAYKGLRGFQERSSFYVWLARIAVNLSINFSRREKFRSFLSIFDILDKPSTTSTPVEKMEEDELKSAIDKATQSLPARQRNVFVLKFHQGFSHKEIAEIMGITEGAVKANYFQAIKKLQKILAPYRR
jgi:RNA polymerase sigma-70 factor (ECF subfamily)